MVLKNQNISDTVSFIEQVLETEEIILKLAAVRNNADKDYTIPTDSLVDNAVAISTDQWASRDLIDFSNYVQGLFHLFNTDLNSSIIYRIMAHANWNAGKAPAFDGSWKEITTAGGITVNANSPDVQTLTDRWAWLLIQTKRASAGTATNPAKLWCRCHKFT